MHHKEIETKNIIVLPIIGAILFSIIFAAVLTETIHRDSVRPIIEKVLK